MSQPRGTTPPVPVPPFDPSGFLPPGRHPAGRTEVADALVHAFPTSEQRPRLHNAWVGIWDALGDALPVPKSWLGGSFVSAKDEPKDIDTCWFLDGLAFDALPEHRQRHVMLVADSALARLQWRCDCYAVVDYPPGHPAHDAYLAVASYWHDAWGHTPPEPGGLRAARGYLEVS